MHLRRILLRLFILISLSVFTAAPVAAAPQQATEFANLSKEELIAAVGPLFNEDHKNSGVLASVSLAQFLLESAYGKSGLCQKANNLFGMKCSLSGNTWPGSTWDGVSKYVARTGEHYDSGPTVITAEFRKYPSVAASIADHSAYLLGAKNGDKLRYAGLQYCMDYREAARIIKAGGYATDPNYVAKVCAIIERYDLTRFDAKESELRDAGSPYLDVRSWDWYYGAVLFCREQQLMSGVGDDRFAPAATMSRAMVVTVLYRLDGSPAVTTSSPFTDLTAAWYRSAVNWANANAIVNGVDDTTFRPDDAVSRQQLAAVLHRYARYKGYATAETTALDGYADQGDIDAYAAAAMASAVAKGYLTGFPDKTLRPDAGATRAQVAAILQRFARVGDFEDVPVTAWYYGAVRCCHEKGLLGGVSATRFGPDDDVSRAMVVTVLHRLAGTPTAPPAPHGDLSQEWYRPAVAWAYAENIAGVSDPTKFGPDEAITRTEAAQILYGYALARGLTAEVTAATVAVSDVAAIDAAAIPAVAWALDSGCLSGYPDGSFGPTQKVNRAQLAAILLRLMESERQ